MLLNRWSGFRRAGVFINNVHIDIVNRMTNQTDRAEHNCLEQAIQAVARETGLQLVVAQWAPRIDDQQVDAVLHLKGHDELFTAEIKKWAPQANLETLIHQVRRLPNTGLLAADYVNPSMAAKLRQQGIQFIDGAGNAYLNQPPVYVYITGNRPEKPAGHRPKEGVARAFEPKGLRVVFALLCDPDFVNAPYRDIAQRADVALGTVTVVLAALKAGEFIREGGEQGERRLVHRRALLTRWVEAYAEKLKPKQWLGDFVANDPYWWQQVDIQNYLGYWGGEVAAAKYTAFLKPKEVTVYLRAPERVNLIRDARLRKPDEGTAGTVHVYQVFWEGTGGFAPGLVHPVLAYADLITTGDPRNQEAAEKLYEDHLAQHFDED